MIYVAIVFEGVKSSDIIPRLLDVIVAIDVEVWSFLSL